MEVVLYSSSAVGFLLVLLGIYLIVKRVRGFKTEINIHGFGTIKTAHHGIAMIFLGLVLLAQSLTGLFQRDELKQSYEQLKSSQAMIVSFLTPSLIADTAFQNYFKAAPPNHREAILRRAIGMLRQEFRRVTDVKQSGFDEKDFSNIVAIYNFLFETNPNDGSALYYKGEVQRLLRKRFLLRENFHQYLKYAPASKATQTGLMALGYFNERTAWIHHLLANDFLCEALKSDNLGERADCLKLVKYHVEKEREYWHEGFIKGETTLSTTDMEKIIKEGMDKSPKSKCPDMS